MIQGLGLSEAVARCVSPDAPEALRLSVARGAIPMAPAERLASLVTLLDDPSSDVQAAARGAWRDLPSEFMADALGDPQLPEPVLDGVACLEHNRLELVCKVLEHPSLGPRTVERFLQSEDEEVLSRIVRNQRLLGQHPALARQFLENPFLPPADRSKLVSLLGLDEEMAEEARAETLQERMPRELLDEAVEGVEQSQNLFQLVQSLSVAEKIKLATLGNKGARRLLIRDSNKLVAVAVIRSPKIREDEVAVIAQDRTVADEVIRVIMARRDWMKGYPLRLALVQNPKTPQAKAVRLADTLYDRDLRMVSKSRNVPSAVAAAALRVLARRGKI